MLLEVQEVTKTYRRGGSEFFAVDHADLSVARGEFVAIRGCSGSGKSTLFHLISGLLKPDSGRVLFEGADILADKGFDFSDYRNRRIGYVIQGQSVLNSFTVLENVSLPGYLSGNRERSEERARVLLKEVGLEACAASYPNQLSGGEMRRVAIARALVNQPGLLMADEVTSNLDRENAAMILELLKRVSNAGIGVLISSHDNLYRECADRCLVMDKGILREE